MKAPKIVNKTAQAAIAAHLVNSADSGLERQDSMAGAEELIGKELTDRQSDAVSDWLNALADELEWQCDDEEADFNEDDEPEDSSSAMAKALAKARGAYTKCKASSGKTSLHNGDTLATLLAGCEPEEVCQLADLVCEDASGTHSAKYAHLNQGQQRMNAGNKIRGRIKREEITEAKVIELAKANLGTLQGRDES